MARAPTELGEIIGNKNARGIYKAMKKNDCLTRDGLRNRKEIVAALALKLAYPPSGWRSSGINEQGQPIGPMVPDFGGPNLHDELVSVLYPYLNTRGKELESKMASFSPMRKRWWQIWK